MADKFKDRYVLGEGYPLVKGLGPARNDPHTELVMETEQLVGNRVPLNWPDELWDKDLPKYRLVLERVE